MIKAILIFLGSIFLGIGLIGIIIPGLPTTPFLLLSAACYVRSSEKLYNWLINHKYFGKNVKNFSKYRAITKRAKIISLVTMWTMIGLSLIFLIQDVLIRVIIFIAGIAGTIVLVRIKTLRETN